MVFYDLFQILYDTEPGLVQWKMIVSGLIWYFMVEYDRIWGLIWSYMGNMFKYDRVCDRIWSYVFEYDPIWSSM